MLGPPREQKPGSQWARRGSVEWVAVKNVTRRDKKRALVLACIIASWRELVRRSGINRDCAFHRPR